MTSTSDRPSSTRDVRQTGINPNHWYVVAQSSEVATKPIAVTLWNRSIVLFRDSQGKVSALEDRCPHRQVKLSHGVVQGDRIECAYHGWCFDGAGKCVDVPYLEENQKLPSSKIQAYPVREQDGFIWLFLGEQDADSVKLFGLPEWDHLNYIATVSIIDCNAHYSYLIENLMDMYHGHLHDNWQAWADPVLQELQETGDRVNALYQAQSYYKIDKIWSISQLIFPALRRLHPEPLNVSYVYPHWASTLGNDFKIYCLFCPRSLTSTRAYLIHFTSLNAFWRLHKLPVPFRQFVKNRLFGSAQKLLDGLVRQDVLMIEEEQQAYLNSPQQRGHEFNRTLASVQRLIRAQADLEANE
ncbi:MAG: aromatic ring-hydroxylating dioxygenase subunit alpha [Leptolyngbyaceae cyanobacterium SM1_3_5]|nr:aromatic ring-hydroxylating dioxygenase subunit alpha [Leptolyngbyaceae cyanobacterium SM1_3_5]